MVHDTSQIQLTPTLECSGYRLELFALYKLLLREHIDQAFGWDESLQRERFDTAYSDQDFLTVTLASVTVGYAVVKQEAGDTHLSLLLLQPEYQHRGIGQGVMKQLMSKVVATGHSLTLSCFLSNHGAMRFYQRLGFALVTTDEYFGTYRYPALPD